MTKAKFSLNPYHYDLDGKPQLVNDGRHGKILTEQEVLDLGGEVHSWAGNVYVGGKSETVYWYTLNYLGEWSQKSCSFSSKEQFLKEAKKLGRKMLARNRKAA